MKQKVLIMAIAAISSPLFAANSAELQNQIRQLQEQTKALQSQLNHLQKQLVAEEIKKPKKQKSKANPKKKPSREVKSVGKPLQRPKNKPTEHGKVTGRFHNSPVLVHTVDGDPESSSFFPTALIADHQVVTYIAGTPVVTSPYTGDRPAFDGSDYIVNISSINRDIRLMEQRRRVYDAYERIGYPIPNIPIIAISGKTEPVGDITRSYQRNTTADWTLGSSELDVAAMMNDKVEAFMSIAYDETPPSVGGPRTENSAFYLNQGFVNIGDLDSSPIYFTAGQLFVPFGRFSSSMVSSPLPLRLARTKSRPFILGYKSQTEPGPYAAVYGFRADTTYGHSGIGGANFGYTLKSDNIRGEIGASYISSITDSAGMQDNGSAPFTTFGGFGSITNGNENVHRIPALGVHANMNIDRYNLTAEWVGVTQAFRAQDLSYNGHGAKPQAAQLEAGVTFMAFSKPASFALGYQWSKDTLALRLPEHRISGVFNISLWKDTVESLEYRHDIDFGAYEFANGAHAPGLVNQNTLGTGRSSDSLIAQIGVYF
ncbi:LbtU family siderophore porin [Legionella jordanis]|uniref:Coiled-coil protein n=1 Tax=Legionella jordanis TaxID=456 RepID=A0A0W0VCZ4_9GAMM|nr:LbtU family siderophore porin [Legionella jordanis]KTD18017.1 coiled-coil protein [Legionella jordanis]RMX02294.1 LbtU family siderophore porin [Legionella jordanis]RMX21221.1 LbtU family siderophore porin [Legionella jordanis]VEH13891.1 coiled-coil protein [Legionella jordanis]HAT8714273.1 LbtU family siderophore porin [Legionella jordanis]